MIIINSCIYNIDSLLTLMTEGNAAEHASAIVFAMRNKLNITLGVAVGSSCQISLMVLPLLVLIGWAVDKPMSMNLGIYFYSNTMIKIEQRWKAYSQNVSFD